MKAKQKLGVQQSHLSASGSQLPNFRCNQPDMVVPQPVYMNMSDLERMQQQQMEEDSLDLKTPTQEDLDNLPSSSDGSSSGYGSQNLASEQVYGDGVNSRGTLLRRSCSQVSGRAPAPP